MVHEILHGCGYPAHELAELQEAGKLDPPIRLAVDAQSVYDAIIASDLGEPAEGSLRLHLLSLRDRLNTTIQRLLWLDTRDMLADGLTKGAVDRAALRKIAADGIWYPVQKFRCNVLKDLVSMQSS